jgi:hypothetical protein
LRRWTFTKCSRCSVVRTFGEGFKTIEASREGVDVALDRVEPDVRSVDPFSDGVRLCGMKPE